MAVTAEIGHADEVAATSALGALDCRSTSSHWPVGIDAGGALSFPGWHFVSAERPYVVVAIDCCPTSTPVDWQQAWDSILKSPCWGSAGIVAFRSDYGPLLPHVGSSSLIVDRRSVKHAPRRRAARLSVAWRQGLPVVDQLKELRAALSLNKSQLAGILRVTRPTLYEWYQGKQPNATNSNRIHALLRALTRAAVSGARPLNARFTRQPTAMDEPSLLDLLCEERLNEERVARALDRARDLGAAADRRRTAREDRLRALGFEDPGDEQRKENLARNVALQDWPGR